MTKILAFCLIVVLFVLEYVCADENNKDLEEVRRRKSRLPYGILGAGMGLHALTVLYWVKVKIIIVGFAIGMAVLWAFRYYWAQKSCPEIIHEGPTIPFDHGHYSGYSGYSSHSGDYISSSDPYSAYGSYSDHPPPEVISDSPPDHHKRIGRARQFNEDHMSELIFSFLGLDSDACRKRFMCEVEFKAKRNSITSMAFRIFGRGVFSKYIRDPKLENSPKNFYECGKVHKDCVFIEDGDNDGSPDQTETTTTETGESSDNNTLNQTDSMDNTTDINDSPTPEERVVRRNKIAQLIYAKSKHKQ